MDGAQMKPIFGRMRLFLLAIEAFLFRVVFSYGGRTASKRPNPISGQGGVSKKQNRFSNIGKKKDQTEYFNRK